MTGNLDMNSNFISNVLDPENDQDVATKKYVLDQVPTPVDISELEDKTANITDYITDIRTQNQQVMEFIDACVQHYDKRDLKVKLIDELAELNSKQKLLFTPGKKYDTRHHTRALQPKTLFFGSAFGANEARWNKRIL